MMRETVELVTGDVYWSDDHWVTVMKAALGGLGGGRRITGKDADRIRYIAAVQHGSGRNDPKTKKRK